MKFRLLKPSEVECRVSTVTEKGVSLLLYKDARVDQNILDETLGIDGWQRDHKELKGNIYCGVAIYSNKEGLGQWIWKWDAGSESNTEAVKGEASDSFKRACFNLGIGRELYTAPFIWVNKNDVSLVESGKDNYGKIKYKTFDRFSVRDISYSLSSEIIGLAIVNEKTGKVVFTYGGGTKGPTITDNQIFMINNLLDQHGIEKGQRADYLATEFGITKPREMSQVDAQMIIESLDTKEK
jgi:hypothetical protein